MTNIGNAELKFTLDDSDLDRSLGRISTSAKREGQKAEKALTDAIRKGGASGGRAGGGAFVREMSSATNKAAGAMRSALSKAGEGILQGVGQQLTGIAVQAGGAVKDFLGSSIAAAGDYNRAMGGIRKTIEQTGGAAQRSAEQLDKQAQALGRSTLSNRQEVLKMQQALLTFKSVSGDVFDDAVGLSLDMAAAMGTDAKSSAVQLGKALENPTKGISALSRAGVTFNDQQKEQIKSLQEQNKLYDAQQIVLNALKGQLGGVARAQATGTEGSLDTLNEEINDLKISLGQAIAPVVERAFATLTQVVVALSQAFQSLSPEGQSFVAVSGAVVAGVAAIATAVGGLSVVINTGLITSIGAAVAAAAPFIAAGAAVAGAIALVVAGVRNAVNWWDGLSEAQRDNVQANQPIQAAIGATIDAVRQLGQWVRENVPIWVGWAQTVVGTVVNFASGAIAAFNRVIEGINTFIVILRNAASSVSQWVSDVVGFFTNLRDNSVELVTNLAESVTGWFSSMVDSVTSTISSWVSFIVESVQSILDRFGFIEDGLNAMGGVWDSVMSAAKSLTQGVSDTVAAFAGIAKKSFDAVVGAMGPVINTLKSMINLAKDAASAIASVGGGGGDNGNSDGSITNTGLFNSDGTRIRSVADLKRHWDGRGNAFDIALEKNGSPNVAVPSPFTGKVIATGYGERAGNFVKLQDEQGRQVLIAHLSKISVQMGQLIKRGAPVGIQGSTGARSTGPHIHFETYGDRSVVDDFIRLFNLQSRQIQRTPTALRQGAGLLAAAGSAFDTGIFPDGSITDPRATGGRPSARLRSLLSDPEGIGLLPTAEEIQASEAALSQLGTTGQTVNDQLTGIGKSLKDGLISAIVEGRKFSDVIKGVVQQLAKLALNFAFKSIFGGLFGDGGASFFGFRNGGRVPNFAGGGMVSAIDRALTKEGPGSVLAALTPGEQVLSRDNGDAQFFRHLHSTGQWQHLRQINNYRNGGAVGRSAPTARATSFESDRATITVDRINNVDYVSMDQLSEILTVQGPIIAQQGAAITERNLQSSNWRRSFGVR